MELVGRPIEFGPGPDDRIYVAFRCCNEENFTLVIPPALLEGFEVGKIVRVWAHHFTETIGSLSEEAVIEHWESLE